MAIPNGRIVVRVDEVGRAEALAYDAVEAKADPLDPTTKYFLNRFIHDYYSRREATSSSEALILMSFMGHYLRRVAKYSSAPSKPYCSTASARFRASSGDEV